MKEIDRSKEYIGQSDDELDALFKYQGGELMEIGLPVDMAHPNSNSLCDLKFIRL